MSRIFDVFELEPQLFDAGLDERDVRLEIAVDENVALRRGDQIVRESLASHVVQVSGDLERWEGLGPVPWAVGVPAPRRWPRARPPSVSPASACSIPQVVGTLVTSRRRLSAFRHRSSTGATDTTDEDDRPQTAQPPTTTGNTDNSVVTRQRFRRPRNARPADRTLSSGPAPLAGQPRPPGRRRQRHGWSRSTSTR